MRKHNGMRPQDVVILLKIISLDKKPWQLKDLAHQLSISGSEVSESLNRSYLAGLIDFEKKKVKRQGLMEFIQFGLHYVFPQHPGAVVNGISTAHSHPFMRNLFESNEVYVWPDSLGKERGHTIEPFYEKQKDAVKIDDTLYLLLSLIDVVRVGRTREVNAAVDKLKEIILGEQTTQRT